MHTFTYSLKVIGLPEIIVNNLNSQKLEKLGCLGVKELDIDEAVVDQILGEKSYCGGEISEDVMELVEEYIRKNSEVEFYLKGQDISQENFISILFEDTPEPFREEFLLNGKVEINKIEYRDWNEQWKKNYHPIKINSNLAVIPSFFKDSDRDHEIQGKKIYINPGQGFGTGTHPTTSMCLKYIVENYSHFSQKEIIDYGCGSGILGLYFLKYCEKNHLYLYDIDQDALKNAEDNISINQVSHNNNQYDISSSKVDFKDKKFDLIIANILLPVLKSEYQDFVKLLKPSGELILSGILVEQVDELMEYYSELIDFHKYEVRVFTKGEWACVVLRNKFESTL